VASSSSIKISGTVTGPDDQPAPQVRVSLFPSFSQAEKQTDGQGHFTLTFDSRQAGSVGAAAPIVVARDLMRNLAAMLDLEEGATNANLRLEPALTLASRITDADGNALTNSQVQLWFQAEPRVSKLGAAVHTDAKGGFEIKALPRGRQYTVNASAKGFGQERRIVPASDTATNRLELEPFQLARADRRIGGVVLDEDDKPVARASVYFSGDNQPNLNALTDANGQFSIDKVCIGPIHLSANSRNGGYANVMAEGGDTNIVIRITSRRIVSRAEPRIASFVGKPLPNLAPLGLTAAEVPTDQPVLAVLIDAEQRPSRRALRLLGEQAAAIKEKGIIVIVLHTGTMADDEFKIWKKENALPFPIVSLNGDAEKARNAWGAGALPWLILTDKAHRVTAEGFSLEELDSHIKDTGK